MRSALISRAVASARAEVDDPNFDLRNHIRQTALLAPGGDEQLSNLMARVMAQRLDRDYPLWEYWLVEALRVFEVADLAPISGPTADVSGRPQRSRTKGPVVLWPMPLPRLPPSCRTLGTSPAGGDGHGW